MHLNEYIQFDGLGLAALVRRKEVSAAELLQTALTALERTNPTLNAVIATLEDEARATLKQGLPEGPFTGVPFLIKDIILHAANVPTAMGSRVLKELNLKLPYDSTLMTRYRRAGVVLMGRTNLPELGLLLTTEPQAWGPTRNPWDLERSPGGSSGGTAAAVRAGVVPLGHGSDGGGSLRVPAAMCGLFGLKPTRGRISAGPNIGDLLNGFCVEHVLTRSVRDSAAMLDATAGADFGDPYIIPPPERPFREEAAREPGRLRVAFSRKAPSGVPVSPECVAAVEDVARMCASLGHDVIEAVPQYSTEALDAACAVLWTSGFAAWVDSVSAMLGHTLGQDSFEASTWATVQHGRTVKGSEVQNALGMLNPISRAVGRFFAEYDVLLTPTLAVPPFRLGYLDGNAPLSYMEFFQRQAAICPFTVLFNATGQPAMNVPLHWSSGGLPIGVQFAGRWGDEATLFRLAGQLEQARPWAQRWPRFNAASPART
ncbi:amidase [Hyalangium rubrum]|uniref:Amidase n=1 Tax=Hyalangium rubrum TaxID=3103134 RepID=A0ABU5H644_9BACT|nr:amidase [Hyalangium sp. s54d21]MDY7228950.1 amidase [Hyalangium sp. s54d21]